MGALGVLDFRELPTGWGWRVPRHSGGAYVDLGGISCGLGGLGFQGTSLYGEGLGAPRNARGVQMRGVQGGSGRVSENTSLITGWAEDPKESWRDLGRSGRDPMGVLRVLDFNEHLPTGHPRNPEGIQVGPGGILWDSWGRGFHGTPPYGAGVVGMSRSHLASDLGKTIKGPKVFGVVHHLGSLSNLFGPQMLASTYDFPRI